MNCCFPQKFSLLFFFIFQRFSVQVKSIVVNQSISLLYLKQCGEMILFRQQFFTRTVANLKKRTVMAFLISSAFVNKKKETSPNNNPQNKEC